MNAITGEGTMQIGGAERPYYIGTRQTAIFCELMSDGFDLQDYNALLGQVLGNSFQAAEAREKSEAHTPQGRKELTPTELECFIYSALAAGAQYRGLPVEFTVQQVSFWIDEAENTEVVKPMTRHIHLLAQKLARQAARPGNAPAPALKASRGGQSRKKK